MNFRRLRYFFGTILSLPLLPIIYKQGKSIQSSVPILAEAKEPEGVSGNDFTNTFTLLCIGESTIAGVGVDSHKNGFSGHLARTLSELYQTNFAWKVVARSGYTAKRITMKLIPKATDLNPDLIIIGLGANDAFTLNTPWAWKKDLQHLLSELENAFGSTPVVFINMPPIKVFPAFSPQIKWVIGNLVELLGLELKEIVNTKKHVYYSSEVIRLEDWISQLEKDQTIEHFFSDGVHPSSLTYRLWADEIAHFIKKNSIL